MRRARLIELLNKYKASGKVDREFADAAGLAPAHVSQMKNGTRAMGDEVARRIESSLGLPFGWMDGAEDESLTAEERELVIGYRVADDAIKAAARRLLIVEDHAPRNPSKRVTIAEDRGTKRRS